MTMEINLMDVRRNNAANFPLFANEMFLRDALATYVRVRWPKGTAKAAAIEFDLTLDEGRGLAAGKPGVGTIDKILRHPNGGWHVALPVMGAVIGEGVDQFIQAERKRHAQAALRERALLRDLRALAPAHRVVAAEPSPSAAQPARSFRGRVGEG